MLYRLQSGMNLLVLVLICTRSAAQIYPRGNSTVSTKSGSSSRAPVPTSAASPAPRTTSRQTSTITSSAALAEATTTDGICDAGTCDLEPASIISWKWPPAIVDYVTVATVIHRVNTIANITQTVTSFANFSATLENNPENWNAILSTTGVSVIDGVAVVTPTFSIYTDVNKYFTTAVPIRFPDSYTNYGWLGVSTTMLGIGTNCTAFGNMDTFGLRPTAPLRGQTALYAGTVGWNDWFSVLGSCTDRKSVDFKFAPQTAVTLQGSLTATTTEYDNNIHSQSSSMSAIAAPARTGPVQSETVKPSVPGSAPSSAAAKQPPATSPAPKTKTSISHQQPQKSQAATQEPSQQIQASQNAASAKNTQAISPIVSQPITSTNAVVVGSSTLQPGSTAIISGTTYSVKITASGTAAVTALIANGQTVSTIKSIAQKASAVVVSSSTIQPGSAAVISGTTYSVQVFTSGLSTVSALLANGQTISIITHTTTAKASTLTPIVIASSTLFLGSAAVISGTTYSLEVTKSGSQTLTDLIVNGQTLTTASAIGGGYGSLTYAGFGETVTASMGSPSIANHAGDASSRRSDHDRVYLVCLLIVTAVVVGI